MSPDVWVLYGLPGNLGLAGKQVQVRERKGMISVWSQGQFVVEIAKRPRSQEGIPHPEQWSGVAGAASIRRAARPLGHVRPEPEIDRRSLQEYDQYCGVTNIQEVLA